MTTFTTKRSLTLFAATAALIVTCGVASAAQNTAQRQLEVQPLSEAAPVAVADVQGDKSQQAAPAISDDQAWAETLKSNTPDAYKAYVDAFPSGVFVLIAKDRMAPKTAPDAPVAAFAPKEPASAPSYHRPQIAYAETKAYGEQCDHEKTAYTPSYQATAYVSHYDAPIYQAPSYAPTYHAPSYVSTYQAPAYVPTYYAPTYYAPSYHASSYVSTYQAPTYYAPTYHAPSYAPTYHSSSNYSHSSNYGHSYSYSSGYGHHSY